jgi:hypothetical protein
MKLKNTVLMACLSLFLVAAFTSQAQKPDVYEGSFSALKGEKKINVQFTYEDMSVGKFDKEEDYLNEKVTEKNKDEAGSGDTWKQKWIDDREFRFEPKFFELFNEYGKNIDVMANDKGDGKYTLIINTYHTEPGFNVGVMRRPAHIHADLWLVETTNQEKVLGKMRMEKVPGRDAWGFDFDSGYRLQESYAVVGKILAKYLDKKVY